MNKRFEITVPNGAPQYPTSDPDFFPVAPTILLSVAKKGSGKTCSLTNYLHMLHKMDRLDRLILVSPTFWTNQHYFKGLPLHSDDILEPSVESASIVMGIVDDEARLFDEYHARLERWTQLQKELKSRKPIELIDEDLLLMFEDNMVKPEYKYMRKNSKGKMEAYKPVIYCFFDDCQSTMAYSSSKANMLNYMVIRHRHIGQIEYGDKKAIGCNLMFALQNYTTSTLGIPRAVRGNANVLCIFPNKNVNELKLIAEELSGEIAPEVFYRLHEEACSKEFGFLVVDLNPLPTAKSQFRRCFNEYLYP